VYILCFWMLFVLDSFIVLFTFCLFICMWILIFLFAIMFLTVKIKNVYLSFDFISSKYVDLYWFSLGSLFIIALLARLSILLYFSALNMVCFDLCKCVGFQWYWVYYIFNNYTIFSNLLIESDYLIGDMRILQCNNVLTLLSLVIYKLWLTSIDVIHSFTLASLGIKVDCVPGRCNEVILYSSIPCTIYGQCSELCGVLHGFMPIVVIFV